MNYEKISEAIKTELENLGLNEKIAEARLTSILQRVSTTEKKIEEQSSPESLAALKELERRFIVRTNATADLDHWLNYTSYNAVEAAYLLNNLDPDKVFINDGVAYGLSQHYPSYISINKFTRVIARAISDGVVAPRQGLFYWLALANHFGLSVDAKIEGIIGDLVQEKVDDATGEAIAKPETTWEVNENSQPSKEFYAELKKHLRKKCAEGASRPTPASLRNTLKAESGLIPLFIEVDRYNDIHYYIDSAKIEKSKIQPRAWETLINRYVVKL